MSNESFLGRQVYSDAEYAAYCNALPSPLREDIACTLWWDNVDRQPMPLTHELCNMYQHPQERKHADREQVVAALIGIGYSEDKAARRVWSEVEYHRYRRDYMRKKRKEARR